MSSAEGPGGLQLAHLERQRRLQPAEAEIQSGRLQHGPREPVLAAAPASGQLRQLRPARVGQAQQLGALVEGLAGRVIEGLAEDPVAAEAGDLDQQRMPARDQQGDEGKVGLVVLQQGGQQVRLHVVDGHRRDAPAHGEADADGGAHQQRAHQARTRGVGHPGQVGRDHPGLGQGGVDQGQELADMVPGGQFRDDAPEGGMGGHLAVQAMAAQPPGRVVHGRGGFVAAGFDAQNDHFGSITLQMAR